MTRDLGIPTLLERPDILSLSLIHILTLPTTPYV